MAVHTLIIWSEYTKAIKLSAIDSTKQKIGIQTQLENSHMKLIRDFFFFIKLQLK